MRTSFRVALTALLVVAQFVPFAPFPTPAAQATYAEPADEMLFYRDDGLFVYYDMRADGRLGRRIAEGSGYTADWSSIVAVDLDGDGQDEMLFYRADGLFVYYDIGADGRLGRRIAEGSGYTADWSSIVAVDLDGDGQDEMLFYRADGLFVYYDIGADGRLGRRIAEGSGYTADWSSIVAVDLDGDGQDEMLFYRADGLFVYYDIGADGRLGRRIAEGSGYTADWSSIVAVDLDGDGQDEMLFYRADGLFVYYDIGADGRLGRRIAEGSGYTADWSSIVAVDLDQVRCDNPFTSDRLASLKRRYPNQSFAAYIYDTRSRCIFEMYPGARLRTASVFKVMVMAGTLLEAQEAGRPLSAWERSQLVPMITRSANEPVRALWRHFGASPWFDRQTAIFGLDETTAVGDTQTTWGRTTTSAEDQANLIRQVLLGHWGPLEAQYRAEAWRLMTSVVPSQTWGITAGVPSSWTVAQKNGFAGHIANSAGFVQRPGSSQGYVIVVLSNGWSTWTQGVPAVEQIAGWVSADLAR